MLWYLCFRNFCIHFRLIIESIIIAWSGWTPFQLFGTFSQDAIIVITAIILRLLYLYPIMCFGIYEYLRLFFPCINGPMYTLVNVCLLTPLDQFGPEKNEGQVNFWRINFTVLRFKPVQCCENGSGSGPGRILSSWLTRIHKKTSVILIFSVYKIV